MTDESSIPEPSSKLPHGPGGKGRAPRLTRPWVCHTVPEPSVTPDPHQLQRLLTGLRSDFDQIRQSESPISIRLIHKATNAEVEGIAGWPTGPGLHVMASVSAGNREVRVNVRADGSPEHIDLPVLGPDGQPWVDAEGRGIDVKMPAFRQIEFTDAVATVARQRALKRLLALAERGGRLAAGCPGETVRLLSGWTFTEPAEAWWALVFELAWSGRHPTLTAKRNLWCLTKEGQLALLPYDSHGLRVVTQPRHHLAIGEDVISRWIKRLPDAYLSELADVASACFDLAGLLADECAKIGQRPPSNGAAAEDTDSNEIAALVDSTPALACDGVAWVKNTLAAELEGVKTETLGKYRRSGIASLAKTLGRDPDGRVWRRAGTPWAHAWYLRATLRSSRGITPPKPSTKP